MFLAFASAALAGSGARIGHEAYTYPVTKGVFTPALFGSNQTKKNAGADLLGWCESVFLLEKILVPVM